MSSIFMQTGTLICIALSTFLAGTGNAAALDLSGAGSKARDAVSRTSNSVAGSVSRAAKDTKGAVSSAAAGSGTGASAAASPAQTAASTSSRLAQSGSGLGADTNALVDSPIISSDGTRVGHIVAVKAEPGGRVIFIADAEGSIPGLEHFKIDASHVAFIDRQVQIRMTADDLRAALAR